MFDFYSFNAFKMRTSQSFAIACIKLDSKQLELIQGYKPFKSIQRSRLNFNTIIFTSSLLFQKKNSLEVAKLCIELSSKLLFPWYVRDHGMTNIFED